MRIMLIHPSAEEQTILHRALITEGYHRIMPYYSLDCVKHFLLNVKTQPPCENTLPDVILMDDFNCSEQIFNLCSLFREDPLLHHIPILLLSDTSHMAFLQKAIEHGVTDYIQKPVHPTEMLNRTRLAYRLKQETEQNMNREKELANMFSRMQEDVQLARQIQFGILPPETCEKNIHISAAYLPSEHLSGDMYYWVKIDEHRYSVILIDVVGHGIHAALISMSVRSLLHGLLTRVIDPILVMQELNKHIHTLFAEHNKNHLLSYYFTTIYAVIDTREHTIEYVNAGHPSGFFLTEENEITMMNDGCPPIGLISDMAIKTGKLHYNSRTKMVFFTDGLVEMSNHHFWTDNLKEHLLQSVHSDNFQLMQHIVKKRNIASPQRDDICIIIIDLTP
ncbi:SpoIIE family protein phosphatase [Bacillus tianshenii]|nr:SpoIIE family protein phosphatase [Bacillus tianshenii]